MQTKAQCLNNSENIYQLKINDMIVEMKYADSHRKINDCLLKILMKKSKIKND